MDHGIIPLTTNKQTENNGEAVNQRKGEKKMEPRTRKDASFLIREHRGDEKTRNYKRKDDLLVFFDGIGLVPLDLRKEQAGSCSALFLFFKN